MRTQQTVADLEKKVRELSILLEVSRVINSDLEDQSILRTVLEQAMAVIRGRGYDPIAVAALEMVGAAEMAWLMNLKDFQPSTRELLGRA
ncbi:MAG: hypothetical protein Q7U96_02310 [Chloroflexota bacterium]|nr:hypothetical protein [Chloroflexota bacterium]